MPDAIDPRPDTRFDKTRFDKTRLDKVHLIDGIVGMNPSATPDWLSRFDRSALTRYLNHLCHAVEPRGRHSVWLRDDETAAVVTRAPCV